MFDVTVLHEDDECLDYSDVDGVERHFLKNEGTIPTSMKWPITGKKSWQKLKDERLNLNNIKQPLSSRIGKRRLRNIAIAIIRSPWAAIRMDSSARSAI